MDIVEGVVPTRLLPLLLLGEQLRAARLPHGGIGRAAGALQGCEGRLLGAGEGVWAQEEEGSQEEALMWEAAGTRGRLVA